MIDINQKITAVKRVDYITGCVLAYPYFQEYYKLILIDLSEQ